MKYLKCSNLNVKSIRYDSRMDKAMIPLCNRLNAMTGITTTESCEGHGRTHTDVWFHTNDFISIAKIQRAIDRRYSSLVIPWVLECCTVDVPLKWHPPVVFWLHSANVYKGKNCRKFLLRDLCEICLNLEYYHTNYYNRLFRNPLRKYGDVPEICYNEYLIKYEEYCKAYKFPKDLKNDS